MPTTFADVANDANIKNGILAPGEQLDPQRMEYCMREGNRLLDQWNIQSDFIWTTNILVFDLTALPIVSAPDKTWYTIGPSTIDPTVDFDAPRPTRIVRANLLLTSSSPKSRVPLEIIDDLQWSDETVPQLGTTIPNKLYNDGGNPISRLYVWPYPTVTQNQLELFVWNQVSRFTDPTDEFVMPPGYEDAFMLTLSCRTAEGIRDISPTLLSAAAMARATVKGLNNVSPKISTTDSGIPNTQRAAGNFYNGWPVQPGP